MGTAHPISQAGTPAAPELPSISITALAVGLSDLLRAADGLDLPARSHPRADEVLQPPVRVRAREPQGSRPLGAPLRRRPGQREPAQPRQAAVHLRGRHLRLFRGRGPRLRLRPDHLRPGPPHRTGHECRAWGTAIPRPGQPIKVPNPSLRARSVLGMSNATSATPGRVVLDWRYRPGRPGRTVRAVRPTGDLPVPGQGRALPQGLRRSLDHRPGRQPFHPRPAHHRPHPQTERETGMSFRVIYHQPVCPDCGSGQKSAPKTSTRPTG